MVYARNALTASPTPKRPVSLLLPAGPYTPNDPKEGTKELYCIVIVRFWGQTQSARQYDVPSRSGFRIRALWWLSCPYSSSSSPDGVVLTGGASTSSSSSSSSAK